MPDEPEGRLRDKIARLRLDRHLNLAVELGALTETEADEMREEAASAMVFLAIFELVMMVLEIIRAWRSNR